MQRRAFELQVPVMDEVEEVARVEDFADRLAEIDAPALVLVDELVLGFLDWA